MAIIAEINGDIRFFLGNADQSFISDSNLNRIIQTVIDRDASYTDCDVYYYSLLECIRFVLRAAQRASGGAVGAGGLKRRRQREGDIEVEEEYHQATSSTSSSGLEQLLEDLINNPNQIGCAITRDDTTVASSTGSMIIGGVSKAEGDRIAADSDAVSPWKTASPFRSHLYNDKDDLIG